MPVITLSNAATIHDRHIMHVGPITDPLLPPWDDEMERDTLAKMTAQMGFPAKVLLPSIKAEYEATRQKQIALLTKRDALRKEVSTAHTRHAELLKPLVAEQQRIEQLRDKAAKAVADQEASNRAETAKFEADLQALIRELAGLPAHKPWKTDTEPPKPISGRAQPNSGPPPVKVIALSRVCVGVERHLDKGEVAEVDPDTAAFLVAIGKVKRAA